MRTKYKFTTEEAQTLLGMLDIFFKCSDTNGPLILIYGSVLSDIYKKVFKVSYKYAEFYKSSAVVLTNLEVCLILEVIKFNDDFDTYFYENIQETKENIRDKKLFLSFDQQIPAHLVKPINMARALIRPLTGNYSYDKKLHA